MKHFRHYILLLLPLLLVAGCGGWQPSVQKTQKMVTVEMDKANKLLAGKYLDNMTILDSITFDGKNVVYHNTIDEDRAQMTIKDFMDAPVKDALEFNLQLTWATNPNMEPLKNRIKRLNGMIYYHYFGSRTGDSFSIEIDPED